MPASDRTTTEQPEIPAKGDSIWNLHPVLPLENARIFIWPPNPLTIVKTIASYWLAMTGRVVILAIAILCWLFVHPDIETCVNLEFGWIAQIYLRNLALLVLVAGGLHLYLFTYAKQGERLKFDVRGMIRNGRMFAFRDQVRDNMFWSIISGVFFWTAFEVAYMWAYANGYAPQLTWGDNPVWFVAIFVLIPLWYSFYFYWTHRALHWPPLYRFAHAVHHRNINVGPWSGASMHPVEHFIYFGSILIHFIVPSNLLHVIFHLQFNILIAVLTHSGFESLLVGGRKGLGLGYFFHQLHHRYFECNYGTDEMPWDKWFGTFHDGTSEAAEVIRERRRRMHGT